MALKTLSQLHSFYETIDGIDWELLAKQKTALVRANRYARTEAVDLTTGIIHLLDALQDDAKAAGLWINPASETQED